MIAKIVSHVIVWLVAFLLLAWFLETIHVAPAFASSQVSTGLMAESEAPRVAAVLEYGVASLVAYWVAMTAPGLFVAGWLKAFFDWALARLKAATAKAPPPQASTQSSGNAKLKEYLAKQEARIAALEARPVPVDEAAIGSLITETVRLEVADALNDSGPAPTRRTRSTTKS